MNRELREDVLKLIEEKEKLENEIRELNGILAKNNVKMTDPLVDEMGFPLANVDVYQVRHARHLLITKQNDHKHLMKQIEDGIAEYYKTAEPPALIPDIIQKQRTEPFARITMIHEGSPAEAAGIRDGDLLVEFGSVNAENFRTIADIGTVVQYCHGQKINLRLKRGEQYTRIAITPRKWQGNGLLGCNVVPLQN